MPLYLAIDFGTTNSVLARWNDQRQAAELVHLPGISQEVPPPLIPSLVYVKDGQGQEIIFGQPAKEMLANAPQDGRIFRDFKRGLLTADAATSREIDGVRWNHGDAGKAFIHTLTRHLPFPQSEIEQLVLTVPVTAFSHYLSWLTDTFSELQIEKVRVVDESTAAALGYAVTEPGALVLVIDFGGGSLDLSLVKLPESRSRTGGFLGRIFGVDAGQHAARVVAKAGQVLGGSDVDRWMMTEVLHRGGIEPRDSDQQNIRLLTACEAAKIQLSSEEHTTINLLDGNAPQTITRKELEDLLHQNRFSESLEQALYKIFNTARREGIFREDIQNVLLVGGMSQMPLVQETLANFFPGNVLRSDKPFTAVVEGALQIAAGFGLEDYLPHSYGLRHFDIKNGITTYEEILPAGTRYPSENPAEVLLSPAHEGQQTLELVIGEIDTEGVSAVDVQYEEGEPIFVARLDEQKEAVHPVNLRSAAENRIPLNPDSQPGEACLRTAFHLDANRRLFASVTDLKSGDALLQDALLADMEETTPLESADEDSGFEPAIVAEEGLRRTGIRLSIRQLANLLSANVLPPEAYSIEAAAVMLNHKDFYVRYEAARMLGRRGDRPARLVLQDALENGEAPTRASAIRHVAGLTWYAARPLLQKAVIDPEWRVRECAIYALCDFRDPRAYQLAADTLQTESQDDVFAAAAWGLRSSFEPEAVPVLEASLQAKSLEVRERALESLGTNGNPNAGAVILHTLREDPDPDIQYAAALSLMEVDGEEALPDLVEFIQNGTTEIQLALLRATFHASNYLGIDLGNSRYCDDLLKILETVLADPDPKVRLAAIWPLAWMRHPRADELLLQAYENAEDQVQRAEIQHIAVSLGSPVAESLKGEDGT